MGEPNIRAHPAALLGPVQRTVAVDFQAVLLFVEGLAQMRMQAHAILPGQLRTLDHDLGIDRERRARRDRDLTHGEFAGIVEFFDEALAVLQRLVRRLDQLHGRQKMCIRDRLFTYGRYPYT